MSVNKLDINNDCKNEIRKKVTNNLNFNLNKVQQTSHGDLIFENMLKVTKNFLRENPDVKFTNSNKGNTTVCMYKSVYYEKMSDLLNDSCTYKLVKSNPLNKLQSNTNKL